MPGNLDEEGLLVYYFPVPKVLGKQKRNAEALLEVWREKLGPTEFSHANGSTDFTESAEAGLWSAVRRVYGAGE